MANGTVFPAFLKAEYQADPAAFARFESDMAAAAGRAKSGVERQLSGLSDTISRALSVPRNAFGSLDLGIDQLRNMERELSAVAIASREVATAMRNEATANQTANKARFEEVRAAFASTRATEEKLAALRQEIALQDRIQAELNQTASATQAVIASTGRGTTAYRANTESVRGMRQATTQAGQQLQDIVISLGSGQRATTVFAQQLPQLAFALSDVGGRTGAVARVLAGPWGVALAGGIFLLGGFIEKMLASSDATDANSKALQTNAQKFDLQKNSVTEVTQALREYNAEQERSRAITLETAKATAAKIEQDIKEAISVRQKLKALLEENAVRLQLAGATSGGNVFSTLGGYFAVGSVINDKISEQDKLIAELTKGAKNSVIEVADEIAKINSDPKYQLEVGFERMRNDARATIKDVDALAKRLAEINKQEKASIEALKPERGKRSKSDAGPSLSDAVGSKLLDTAKQFSGLSENNRRENQTLQSFFREANINIDPKITAWCAAFVNAVLATNGLPGNGKLTAESFKNYGKGVDRPELGDIVVLKPGTARGTTGHVGFYAGKGKNGGVMVTAGNTNDKVATAEYGMDRVAAFRRAPNSDQQDKMLEAAQRAAEQFANQLQQIDLITQRITGEFDTQPKLLDRVSIAGTRLKGIIDDINTQLADKELGEDQRKALEQRKVDAEKALALASDATNKYLREMVEESEKQATVDNLRLQGRELEAILLERTLKIQNDIGGANENAAQTALDIVQAEQERARALEKVNRIQQRNLDIVNQTQDNVRSTVRELLDGKGIGAIGNFFKRSFDTYLDGLAQEITDSLFGDTFQKQRLKILGLDKVDEAGREMAVKINRTAQNLDRLSEAAGQAAEAMGASAVAAANDNEIVAEGSPQISVAKIMRDTFKDLGKKILGDDLANKIGAVIGNVMQGVAIGQATSGIAKSLGLKQSKLGSQIGGGIGYLVAGPLGSMVGGFLGGTIGGLLKKTPRGNLSISNTAVGYSGSNSLRDNLTSAGGGIQDRINSIADQLGGTVGNYNLSIRQKGKKFIFNGKKYADLESASEAALLSAIQNGAVQGITAGAQRLLQAGKDLDRQLQKAVSFQGVFDRIKEIEDPVGAALDKLDREFTNLKNIFAEAGASAEEYGQLQRLYEYERAQAVEEANSRVTASLKALMEDLTVNNDARSLTERRQMAIAAYDPLAARVAAGDKTAYGAYADAARNLLDIERKIFGSQSGYFNRLNEVTTLTGQRIEAEANVTSIDRLGLTFNTAIETQTGALLAGLAPILNAINSNLGGITVGGVNDNGYGGFVLQSQLAF